MSDRMRIVRGEDYLMTLKVRDRTTNNPMSLTSATKISIDFVRSNRSILNITNLLRTAQPASAKILTTNVSAAVAGNDGNSIVLVFDGFKSIGQVVAEWNAANPSLLAVVTGQDTMVPVAKTIQLDGGFDSYYPILIQGNPILGRMTVKLNDFDTKSLRLGLNQSLTVMIDVGVHPSGTRILAKFENKLDVID